MKYSLKNKLDLKSEDGATVLLKYIESKQFITKYRCDSTTNALDGFFITKTLIARTKRSPEVIIIIPKIKNTLNTVESNIGDSISLPKSKDIKYPGRSPKRPRLSFLKKTIVALNIGTYHKDNIRSVFDPKGNGHCGYRAISHIHNNNQDDFQKVKADMLVAFEKNKHIYEHIFINDLENLEKKTLELEWTKASHKVPEWFSVPDCAQVVADTYDVPVCIYPNPSDKSPLGCTLTFLPIRSPTKLKIKCKPYILQNRGDVHWLAVNYGHLQTLFPPIQSLYFEINPEYSSLFQKTWNYYGQFPRIASDRKKKKNSFN
ncbi:hypothetical protein K501DRAFT_277234 [Backusella circina FSU 941]|nr:hypothetical protein K501DRAFT_277234 [Backusella circina FSU 941]